MNKLTSIVYPTSFGYKFTPSPIYNPYHILNQLNKPTSNSNKRIRPFFKTTWLGSGISKKGILYLAGYSTHDIISETHRGNISVWCAATIHLFHISVTITNSDKMEIMSDTIDYFLQSIEYPEKNRDFHREFLYNIINKTTGDELDCARAELVSLNKPPLLIENGHFNFMDIFSK